jgi:formylglycine-generating enzyme required for sulfatase activity
VKTNGYEYSGSNNVNSVAWYGSNSGGSTQDVATKQANELGLSDMSGNVWEWCFDITSGTLPVVRGGGWGNDFDGLQVWSSYNRFPAYSRSDWLGLRIVSTSASTRAVGKAYYE